MWFSFIAVFCLFVFSHGYSNKPRKDPVNVETQLDSLNARIDTLLERKEAQILRINTLIGSTIKNRAFQYDYEEVASEDFGNEIRVQNLRMGRLARKIAQIQDLKENVAQLEYQAAAIRDVLNQTDTRDINTQNGINEADYPDTEEITADFVAVVKLQQGIDTIVRRLENNSRTLDNLDFRTAQITTTQEFNTAQSSSHKLLLKSGTAQLDIGYPGFARVFGIFITGFEFARPAGNYPGTTGPGFEVTVDFIDELRVNAYDLSTNGWSTKSVFFDAHANKLQEKRLDIRSPFSYPFSA